MGIKKYINKWKKSNRTATIHKPFSHVMHMLTAGIKVVSDPEGNKSVLSLVMVHLLSWYGKSSCRKTDIYKISIRLHYGDWCTAVNNAWKLFCNLYWWSKIIKVCVIRLKNLILESQNGTVLWWWMIRHRIMQQMNIWKILSH